MYKLASIKSGLMAVVLGLATVAGMSAFTRSDGEKENNRVGYFYKYKLTTYTQAQIENPANYQREDQNCTTGSHVCGVSLATDNGSLAAPDTDEFNDVKDALWASEQADAAQITEIKMRN
ncbi:hypothetical protein [Pedobacter frigidisoli]|uniref:hypothetical protein n=1 Tax=Pedobacter frigidisoli TaxID=2530455 RepID=UPI00293182DB|nr:hypothetical protein [Pedobacter frigidisoli]